MNYVTYVNSLIRKEIKNYNNLICYGQNITLGSCLGGLTRNIDEKLKNKVINSTNSEYSMTGMGFGLAIDGTNAIYFHKQQDFTLLGMDHFVHTWNAMSINNLKAGYTIFSIVVDNGFEGPQSCINMLRDLVSISNIPGYTITNYVDGKLLLKKELVSKGVRFICVSQKLFKTDISNDFSDYKIIDRENLIIKYGNYNNVKIVTSNFGFIEGLRLHKFLVKNNVRCSIINVTSILPKNTTKLINDLKKSDCIVVCDDSKSNNKFFKDVLLSIKLRNPNLNLIDCSRYKIINDNVPHSDVYKINEKSILKKIKSMNI